MHDQALAPHHRLEPVTAPGMTRADFQRHFFVPRRPALLRGACADWDLMQRWTLDYLTGELGDFVCTIARDSRPAYSQEQCTLREYYRDHAHLSTMTFTPFDPVQPLPKLLEAVTLPNPYFAAGDIDAWFYFHSHADAGSLPHCHMDAFNLLRQGVKHWVLYDADPDQAPAGWAALKQCHEDFGAGTHARDWFAEGPAQLRRAGIAVYECEQQPGDIVYIPEHFAHAVLNRSENQGLVVITKRPDKEYRREPGSGYSPNAVDRRS